MVSQNMNTPPGGTQTHSAWKVVLVTAVVAVVIAAIALVGLIVATNGGGDNFDSAPGAQAREVVTDYMDALAEGDVEAAFTVSKPRKDGGTEILPTTAYEKALQSAPITDVVVEDPVMDEISGKVSVTYSVDGAPGRQTFSVHDYDRDGQWEMIPGGASTFVPGSLEGLDVTLNGAAVEQEQNYWLMPGAYEVAIGSPRFTLEGEQSIIVRGRTAPEAWPEPALSEQGVSDFRDAVRSDFDDCLAEKTFDAGCGMEVTPTATQQGWKPVDGTLERTLSGKADLKLRQLQPRLQPGDEPSAVSSDTIGPIDVTYTCEKGGQRGRCELFTGLFVTPTVDLTDPKSPIGWD